MSQTEPRRSDSETTLYPETLAGAYVEIDSLRERLSEYAALGSKLPTVPCPTCGGTGKDRSLAGMSPKEFFGVPDHMQVAGPCPNPDCDGGTVRLTLADAVALAVSVHDNPEHFEPNDTIRYLRSVRATNFGNETINNKGERNGT